MLDKTVATLAEAVKDVRDGATLLVGGFGASGIPTELLCALLDQGARELTVVNNNGGNGPIGLSQLFLAGRVRKLICSFARSANPLQPSAAAFAEVYRAGKIELECVPQGIMVERMRAAAAGLGPFFSPVSYGSQLAEGKETRVIDGKGYVLEQPLPGDYAFVKAFEADRWGNLTYRYAGRNFGPVMCMAARMAVVQVDRIVPLGSIAPDHVMTPGIFVKRVVQVGTEQLMSEYTPLSREQLAQRIADDLPDGSYVNLGIGMPTRLARCLPAGREIILHSENGILGMGPGGDEITDADLINASKEPISLIAGASICDHVVSFTMMRGGHLDITVLGAYQVSADGDLANWDTGTPDAIPAVGGAMDLAVGAKQVWVMMEHTSKKREPKIVERCTLPLTGTRVVDRIYSDLARIDVTPQGLVVRAMVSGLDAETLQALTAAPLRFDPQVAVLRV